MNNDRNSHDNLPRQRYELLRQIERWSEWPLVILGFVWLVLLVLELAHRLDPWLYRVGQVIWAVFIADFVIRFILAPAKGAFLRSNWLTLIALAVPAVRALRVFRVVRAARGIRLVRVIGSINRGMNALGTAMTRRGLPYVIALTLVVLFAGAAGMYAFERGTEGFSTYAESLWWTAMLLTTMGSGFWPVTAEGRFLTLLLSLYALGILGYVAASLATFFIGREAEQRESD